MHATGSPQVTDFNSRRVSLGRWQGGFSLIEVTLAIGIIAFAFVALFGLLPTGLTTFRAAVDATNDTVIMQDLNSLVQVSSWKDIKEKLAENDGGDIYYFDEEGRRTDTKQHQSNKREVVERRLYQVKFIVEPCFQPGSTSINDVLPDARRITVVIGDIYRAQAKTDFDEVKTSDDILRIIRTRGRIDLRTRPFIAARMETARGD